MSAAQYYPKLLSIMGNVLRFLPAFVQMKELLEEGYIGELLVCEAQVKQKIERCSWLPRDWSTWMVRYLDGYFLVPQIYFNGFLISVQVKFSFLNVFCKYWNMHQVNG